MTQEEAEIQAPTGYVTCPVCPTTIKTKGKYGHFSRAHPELNYNDYKDKFVPAKPPEAEKKEIPPGAPYKKEPDVNAILRDILETSRKNKLISGSVVDEIMDWANRMGSMDPNYLTYLLTGMRGVSAQTANIISSKYSLTLQKAQQEGRVQVPFPVYPPTMPTAQGMYPMFPYQPTAQQPFYGSTAPGMPTPTRYPPTAMDIRKIVDQEIEEKERPRREREEKERERKELLDLFDKRLSPLREQVEAIQSLMKPEQPQTIIEQEIFLDAKGKPTTKGKAVTSRIVRQIPPGASRSKTGLDRIQEYKQIKDIFEPTQPTAPPTPPITKEDITKAAEEAAKKVAEAESEKAEIERRQRELLTAQDRATKDIVAAIERSRPPATGVTTPEGVIATAITEAARREPKGIKIIVDGLTGTQPGVVPSEKAGEAQRSGVLEELGKHGLLVRVLERARR